MAIAGIVLGWIGVGVAGAVHRARARLRDSIDDLDEINTDPSDGFCNEERFLAGSGLLTVDGPGGSERGGAGVAAGGRRAVVLLRLH